MSKVGSDEIRDARLNAANTLLQDFGFGEDEVTDTDAGWRDSAFDHWRRVLYTSSADGDHRLVMHVHFDTGSSLVLDHYCLDLATGNMLVA